MMGFGCLGEGSGDNSSLSISNLSALAPPFTVDRLNSNPMFSSNPVLNYSELSYAVEPYSHTSQFASPSAPGHELDIHPTETTRIPLNDYHISDPIYLGSSGVRWSDSAFVYGGGVKPYYSPSVPPMTAEGSTINEYDGRSSNAISPSGLSVSSQLGYNQSLYDLEYGPQWADNVGSSDGTRIKTVGLGGDFSSKNVNVGSSHSYKFQVSQGIYDIPFSEKSQEVSGVACGNLNRVSDSEVYSGLALGILEDRFLEQNADLLPYNCSKPCIAVSGSIFSESYSLGPSYEMHQNVSDFQNLCSPNGNYVLPFDPSCPSSASVMRPSPEVVNRLPPSVNDFSGNDVSSYRTTHTDNVAVAEFEQPGPSKRNDSFPIPSYYVKENFLLPAPGKELTSPVQSMNNFSREFKARVGSQLPDINVSSGFSKSFDSNQVVYSAAGSSYFVDHCNHSVDSPCWKGAPSSLFSAFDIGPRDSLNKNLDQYYGIDHREHQNFHSLCDSTRAFSKKGGEGNINDNTSCGKNSANSLERTLYANSLNREQNLSDGANSFVGTSTMMSGEGIKISNQPIFHNEPSQPRNSESSFDVNFLGTKHLKVEEYAGLSLNDISEGGSVAVCAAEKLLASPSSQEAGYERAKPLPDTKFDVQTMIKATRNLSELLLCHLSCDACCALEERDMEIIKSTISNLDACMRYNTDQETYEPKLKKCIRDTSIIIEESHCMDKISDGPSMTNETFNCHAQPKYKHKVEGKKIESPVSSPLRRGESIKGNDDVTKSIKEILEENFHINEEISSQALLFKNLWLQAEANLCSIGYKARFDKMKVEMAKIEDYSFKEIEDVTEIKSKIQSIPDPNTDSKLGSTHGGTGKGPSLKNSFISSSAENANEVEASIMARFKILKSRGDVIESINMDKKRQPGMDDVEHAGSILERFNILKSRENDLRSTKMGMGQQPEMADCDDLEPIRMRSNDMKPREDNLTPTNKEKEPQSEIANDEHTGSVMARFNILQSREGSVIMYVKEEQPADVADVEFSGKKIVTTVKNDQSEADVHSSPKPRKTGSLSEREFGSKLHDCGYNSPKELHFSVPSAPTAHTSHNGKVTNQCLSRLHDSSLSSDWEHVQKDDLAWKNM
ncbi:hypothetical protein F511_10034 [Dorcoceras hygrometricum]|uniref:Uncharacterized protein n=1 Tax=Dorcoceras hygrometricum TaxID=472368 RepID=A0A2Z7CH96_9LAMI|nr:hypothetical protein F511_10034 [Dorcoceras hygrometricum]